MSSKDGSQSESSRLSRSQRANRRGARVGLRRATGRWLVVWLSALLWLVACGGPGQSSQSEDNWVERHAGVYEAYTRSQFARNLGHLDEAQEYARVAYELEPSEAVLALEFAELLQSNGHEDEAIEVLEAATREATAPYDVYLALAAALEERGDMSEAELAYQQALALRPESFRAWGLYAGFAQRQHGAERAAGLLETYLSSHPDDPDALRQLAGVYRELGRTDEAVAAYRRAHAIDPSVDRDLVDIIATAHEAGDLDVGREAAENCFTHFRQNVPCRVEYVRLLESVPLDEAEREEEIDHVLRTLGRSIGANVPRLQRIAYQLRNELGSNRALSFVRVVADDRPRNTQIQYMAAWAAYRIGDEELAVSYMSRVLEVQPRHADALNFIGYSYAERGIKLDEAEALIRSALEIRPNDGNIQDSLGWVYYKQGNYGDAAHWLEMAVSNIPDSAVLLDHLADVYRALGQNERALDVYRQALSHADDELAETIRQKIGHLERLIPTGDSGASTT